MRVREGNITMLKYIFRSFILFLFFIVISSCGSNLILPEDDPAPEDSSDLSLRKASAGTYRIACYSHDGKTSIEHVIELVAGDIMEGEFIHTEYHYRKDALCGALSFTVIRNSSMNFGAVKGEADQEFSKLLVLPEPCGDGTQVDSPKLNITTNNMMVALYDEDFRADTELEYPDAEVGELEIPFLVENESINYYSHAYFSEGYSDIIVATFMPEFIDFNDRATFETSNIVAAVKD